MAVESALSQHTLTHFTEDPLGHIPVHVSLVYVPFSFSILLRTRQPVLKEYVFSIHHQPYTWGATAHLDVTLVILKNYITHVHLHSKTLGDTSSYTVWKNLGLYERPMGSGIVEHTFDRLQGIKSYQNNSTYRPI